MKIVFRARKEWKKYRQVKVGERSEIKENEEREKKAKSFPNVSLRSDKKFGKKIKTVK